MNNLLEKFSIALYTFVVVSCRPYGCYPTTLRMIQFSCDLYASTDRIYLRNDCDRRTEYTMKSSNNRRFDAVSRAYKDCYCPIYHYSLRCNSLVWSYCATFVHIGIKTVLIFRWWGVYDAGRSTRYQQRNRKAPKRVRASTLDFHFPIPFVELRDIIVWSSVL